MYRTEGLNVDFKTHTGNIYAYATFGAACTEVEIDCLTGDHTVTVACFRNCSESFRVSYVCFYVDCVFSYFCMSLIVFALLSGQKPIGQKPTRTEAHRGRAKAHISEGTPFPLSQICWSAWV